MRYVIRDLPPLRTLPKRVEGPCYNTIRLALRRLGCPLVIQPRGMHSVEMLLERERWLCIDDIRNGLPLLEWTAFETRSRPLHEPVPCLLRLYHVHAGLLMGGVLEATRAALAERLAPDSRSD